MTKHLKTFMEIILLYLISISIDHVVNFFNIEIPSTILGILVVFLLLQTGMIRLEWIETGANWLLGNLMLFLIPSAVGIIQYLNLLSEYGLSLMAVIVTGSFTVMVLTGLFAENLSRRKGKEQNTL